MTISRNEDVRCSLVSVLNLNTRLLYWCLHDQCVLHVSHTILYWCLHDQCVLSPNTCTTHHSVPVSSWSVCVRCITHHSVPVSSWSVCAPIHVLTRARDFVLMYFLMFWLLCLFFLRIMSSFFGLGPGQVLPETHGGKMLWIKGMLPCYWLPHCQSNFWYVCGCLVWIVLRSLCGLVWLFSVDCFTITMWSCVVV